MESEPGLSRPNEARFLWWLVWPPSAEAEAAGKRVVGPEASDEEGVEEEGRHKASTRCSSDDRSGRLADNMAGGVTAWTLWKCAVCHW
jgi:hypothetical protein